MPYVALNNAASTLSGGLTSIATDISVQVGHGAKFAVGANYSYLTLQDASSNIEIVKLTGVSGDVLTVVRAQDGTAARTWAIGDVISCRPCAAAFYDFAVGPQTNTSASKATPVDADELPLADSAATFGLKKLTWANLKATLVTYFNTLFTKLDGSNATGTWSINTSGNAATATNATNAPTSANNLVRAVDLQAQTVTAFTTGGTSTAFTLTPTPAIAANTTNQRFRVNFNAAAGTTPTLAVSGQAALALKYRDSTGAKQAITATQVPINWASDVVNDGTDWVVENVATLPGVTTNSDASTGYVGEYQSAQRLASSAIALTTGTAATVTSLSLTAGDWDVSGQVGFSTAASSTSVTRILAETTTGTSISGADGMGVVSLVYPGGAALNSGGNGPVIINSGVRRMSLSATTTVNLLAYADFGTAGLSAFGLIRARRVR